MEIAQEDNNSAHLVGLEHKHLGNLELIKLHKGLLISFMVGELQWDFVKRKKALKVYEALINDLNIRQYYNVNIRIFLVALLTDRLNEVAKYFHKD